MGIRESAMQFSLQAAPFALCYTMRANMDMFLFAVWAIPKIVKWLILVVGAQHAYTLGQ